jgi:hypothetical protein
MVWHALLTAGGQAIVTGNGTHLDTIADTSGRFSSFLGNTATINNDGQVVFAASLVGGGSGIFIAQHHKVAEIIGTGDPLFGSTVTSFTANPFAPRGFNNESQLGFAANLADGRTVVVRADPLGETDDTTESDPARIEPGRGDSSDLPRLSGFGMNAAAAAVAPIASLQQLGTPTALPATLASASSEVVALEGISVGLLDASQGTSNAGDSPAGGPARDLVFAELDPAWSAWDLLTEAVTQW